MTTAIKTLAGAIMLAVAPILWALAASALAYTPPPVAYSPAEYPYKPPVLNVGKSVNLWTRWTDQGAARFDPTPNRDGSTANDANLHQ